jgi:hypothetical protein
MQANSRQKVLKLSLRKRFVCGGAGVCSEWRNLICSVMVVILPTSLVAEDPSRAMLHNDGGTLVNGSSAPNSSAIFSQDLIQTQKGNTAKIDADGSTVTVQPDTIVQFAGDELVLDHGSLQLNTSRAMKVRVNCLTVIPLAQEWTRYDVSDVDGKVMVSAYQNDVKIHYQDSAVRQAKQARLWEDTVHQGEQVTRQDRCGAATKPAAVGAAGPILSSLLAKPYPAVASLSAIVFASCPRAVD